MSNIPTKPGLYWAKSPDQPIEKPEWDLVVHVAECEPTGTLGYGIHIVDTLYDDCWHEDQFSDYLERLVFGPRIEPPEVEG